MQAYEDCTGLAGWKALITAPLSHALTDQARHMYESQVNGYRNTVFQAFNDVEDQLSTLRVLEQESQVQNSAVSS